MKVKRKVEHLSRFGFQNMSPEKQRKIAAKGGAAVPAAKRTYALDPDFASECGKKGGKAVPPHKRGFAQNRELAAWAGALGAAAVNPNNRAWRKNPELARKMAMRGVEARRKKAEEAKKKLAELQLAG